MKRALLSVSDKSGLSDLARELVAAGVDLVASGGTARALRAEGLAVTAVDQVTGSPEILGGRVKTLHPAIHGGLLARDDAAQRAELAAHGIEAFDLLIVNLYPFREAAADASKAPADVIEQIDIGGPAMIRAAAKTFERVTVVVDPADYGSVAASVRAGGTDLAARKLLARKAFAHTAAYDAAIVGWFDSASVSGVGDGSADVVRGDSASDASPHAGDHYGAYGDDSDDSDGSDADGGPDILPPTLHLALERMEVLRYGENPHQRAARYREIGRRGAWDGVRQHKGATLSFLNLYDAEAAWRLVHAFDEPAAVIVKHANPCGVSVAADARSAYVRAFASDPVAAFGGVVAFNRAVDADAAEALMANPKADVVLAPGYEEGGLERLLRRRKAMRVLELPPPVASTLDVRSLGGGLLVQTVDRVALDRAGWSVPTTRAPSEAEWADLTFAWQVCAAVGSNAIVLANDRATVGIGTGQPSRVDAGRIAASKASGRARGGACASDAFYPFRDGLDAAAEAGVAAVIQPGGSVRDDEVIAAADEHGIAMVLTGERHFRH